MLSQEQELILSEYSEYLLLKVIYDISDVDVVDRSRYDMSFKYFLGMAPEEDVINPSSLCKFRKLRLKDMDLMNLLIKKTVDIAIEKGIIKSKTIIVDATHTAPRSNPYSPIEIPKELLDIVSDHACLSEIPAVKQRLNLLRDYYRSYDYIWRKGRWPSIRESCSTEP